MRLLSKTLRFSRQQQIQKHKIIQILHRKGQNKIWTELSTLGQEPTFKVYFMFHKNLFNGYLGMTNLWI